MPNRDKTGPLGRGPLTGRSFGQCGRGFGRRAGFCVNQSVSLTKEEEKKILEAELESIEIEKQAIEKRIKEIN